MIRVLLADDQSIFRAGTARVLGSQDDICVLGQCGTHDKIEGMLAGTHSAVLLLADSLDADMDRVFAATAATSARLILLTDSVSEPPAPLVRRIDGLLTRHASSADLLTCIRRVGNGERAVGTIGAGPADTVGKRMCEVLTRRELQIVGFIVQGWKNRQIADELRTKEQVVKNYLRSIYDKTGSSDRLELALFTLHHRVLAEAAAKAAEEANLSRA